MADNITRVYRNDSDQVYDIPGLGEILPGQRVTFHGEFPPPINLINYPGLVDVLEEEANDNGRDYEANPEVVTDPREQTTGKALPPSTEESSNG